MRFMDKPKLIGIDFDNTIVNYDQVLNQTARDLGLIRQEILKGKKNVRDHIRALPDGEMAWRRVQAIVYGQRMDEAVLIAGVKSFIQTCRASRIPLFIVSHKSVHASADPEKINLRDAALQWMKAQKFFDKNGMSFSSANVFFESTREEKIKRIVSLRCTHFIDDLEETFLETIFPGNIERLLYSPEEECHHDKRIKHFRSWQDIHEYFFGRASS